MRTETEIDGMIISIPCPRCYGHDVDLISFSDSYRNLYCYSCKKDFRVEYTAELAKKNSLRRKPSKGGK